MPDMAIHAHTPDVLVLGGGGILGEAWMSAVLVGLEQGVDFDARGARNYVGTSAGSIVAASLVAGIAPEERLGGAPGRTPAPELAHEQDASVLVQTLGAALELGSAAVAPLAALAFGSTVAGGALLRRAVLRGVRPGRRSLAQLGQMVERSGVRWDGRLRVAAVELESGRRVMFGSDRAPQLSVAAAVCASCAIPGVFEPVSAGGRSYVDGGVWSPTNMDAAEVHRGDRVLCLNPTGSLRAAGRMLAGTIGPVSRGVSAGEALALRHRGALVSTVHPDQASAAAMGVNLMDPRGRGAVIEAGLVQGRRLASAARRRAA
jgi:NTE family protein